MYVPTNIYLTIVIVFYKHKMFEVFVHFFCIDVYKGNPPSSGE